MFIYIYILFESVFGANEFHFVHIQLQRNSHTVYIYTIYICMYACVDSSA